MKANLIVSPQTKSINGYLNISQNGVYNGENDRVAGDLADLSSLVDTNELSELLCIDIINFYPLQVVQKVLSYWSTLIKHGGTMIVSALDLQEAARLISLGNITDIVQTNLLIYGQVSNVWSIRKSWTPLIDIQNMLIGNGQFDIIQVKFSNDGLFFYLTVRRK